MTPIRALRRQAESNPDGTAFIFADETWTYARLAIEADRCGQAMLARGVKGGDRVALHMANLPELVIAFYACFRIGAIAAPLNARLKTAELRPLLARLRPALYLGQAPLYPQVAGIEPEILPREARYVLGDTDGLVRSWAELFEGAAEMMLPGDPDPDAVALLMATSGTTGLPKFVAHSAATLSAILECLRPLGLAEEQVVINAMPMMHVSGFILTLCSIRYGRPAVLLERFEAGAVLDAIEIHAGTWFLGMPFAFSDMMRVQREHPRDVSTLRMCLAAGDAIPAQVQEEFSDLFGIPLLNIWGATEGIGSLVHGLQVGPVSRVAPDAQIRLVDEAGAPVARGEVGELLLRGPNMALGYWRGADAIDPLAPDGWYRTGDLMRLGEGDEIWFVARKKDLIIRGGSNISPLEVERVLMAHPAVRGAAVVGVPDPVLGQRVMAVVELGGGTGRAVLDDILARTRAQLADYKVPERLTVLGAIPRNNLGKVDRNLLVAMLTEVGAEEMAEPA